MRIARLALLSCLVFVAGCGEVGTDGAAQKRGPAPETLVWGFSVQPDYLNPAMAGSAVATELLDVVFLRLADFGSPPDYPFEPMLASSWVIDEDGRAITYQLRPDVVWEDGTPTRAADVVFTYELFTNPQVPYPQRSDLRRIESCVAVDSLTVRFEFSEPSWEPILETRFHILPRHLLADLDPQGIEGWAFNRQPIGNGWWRVREWLAENRVVLEASETSALGRPHFDRMVLRIIPESTTLRTELLTGGIDVGLRYPSRFIKEDGAREDLKVIRIPDMGYTYVGWNLRNPLFADRRVRQALTMAIDRDTIVEAFRDGFGRVAATPVDPAHPDFNPEVVPLPFDPARAAGLLDAAGWSERDGQGIRVKDGQRFEFTYTLISGNEISEEIATMTKAEFEKLGIIAHAAFYEWTVFLQHLTSKDFDAVVLARGNELILDPESVFHSRQIEGRYNDVSFADAAVDSLIDLGKSMRDREARRQVWWEFQRVLHDRCPITVLYTGETNYPVRRDRVRDPVIDLRGAFRLVHEWHPVERQ